MKLDQVIEKVGRGKICSNLLFGELHANDMTFWALVNWMAHGSAILHCIEYQSINFVSQFIRSALMRMNRLQLKDRVMKWLANGYWTGIILEIAINCCIVSRKFAPQEPSSSPKSYQHYMYVYSRRMIISTWPNSRPLAVAFHSNYLSMCL